MVEALLRASLRHRVFVLLASALLIVIGATRAARMPVDVFPDLTAPRVTIVTESTGMATEEVEQLITFPIEAAVNGTSGLRRVRSASAPGISIVWAEFDWDTTQTAARQRIAERIQAFSDVLPAQASAPLLAPASSVMGEIAFVALVSDTLPPMELRRIADTSVRRKLLGIQGISQVVSIGGDVKQFHIHADPHRLQAYGLALSDVIRAVQTGSKNAPGGYVVDKGQESVVRVLGRASSTEAFASIVVAHRDGLPIAVRDVATVTVGAAVKRGTASYNAQPAVLMSVVKQPDADTLSTTRRLDAALDELHEALAARGVTVERDVFRQQDFIDTAIANVLDVLRDGSILVVAVLFAFLWSLRPTIISVVAIPLSLLSAVLVLDVLGFRIDTMTLGGLAIAIGELVDDAIVDVENVSRRLRERAMSPEDKRSSILSTVLSASLEIRSAIVSATIVLMLVFLPLLFLGDLEGRLLRPLAIAYLAAIFASLIVAITVTPVLCSFLLANTAQPRAIPSDDEPPLLRWLSRTYPPILRACMARPRRVAAGSAIVVVVGLLSFFGLGRTFLPTFNEGSLTISMVLPPGTSLDQSDALGTLAETVLLDDPAVVTVGRRTGRAERDEHVLGVESSEIEVRIDPEDERTRERLFDDLRARLAVVPAQFTLGQPISHRIEHMISGQRATLSVKVFGDHLGVIRRVADDVRSVLERHPNIVDLGVEQIVEIPQISITAKPHAAGRYGLSSGQVAEDIGYALWGATPAHVFEQGTITDVVVKFPDALHNTIDAVRNLPVATPSGAMVPASALADIQRTKGPNYVLRENVSRRVVVTANVADRDVAGVVDAARQRVAQEIAVPDGVRIEFAGPSERQAQTNQRLILLGIVAVVGIAFVVTTTLGSWRRAAIVLVNLPLALAGGVVGVFFAGGVLSIATTIGFIALFGIATRNGILLATRTNDLEAQGHARFDAVEQASTERLAPILMTAATAALGLLPLALAIGEPGSEIQAPMAMVILTGLVTSTALNMVVVPAFLSAWGGTPPLRSGQTVL